MLRRVLVDFGKNALFDFQLFGHGLNNEIRVLYGFLQVHHRDQPHKRVGKGIRCDLALLFEFFQALDDPGDAFIDELLIDVAKNDRISAQQAGRRDSVPHIPRADHGNLFYIFSFHVASPFLK